MSPGGCVIPGSVGEDPDPEGTDSAGDASATGTGGGDDTLGHTSADPSATAGPPTATAGPPTATGTTTTATDGGSISASATVGPVDPESALEICMVPLTEPIPGGSEFQEFVECADGCVIEAFSGDPIDLFLFGPCLCEVMECGEHVGGGGTVTSGVGETGDTEGPPDGCGPFPPGMGSLTCTCEICDIDVNDVDGEWLDNEADPEAICACMCGNTGCGLPV